jgi:heat shock protein HtpX
MWEQIRSNQIRSAVLTIGMGILLLALGYFLGLYFFNSPVGGLIVALIVWGIMALIAYFQGDSVMLSVAGAKRINKEDHPRLYNIVEEMKIASGLPKIPDIYIIDDPALNAFATGRDPEHASVAITSGLLQKLNRDELQGVIAHEMSHVKNRDILLMIMAGVMLGTVVMLSWFASRALFLGGGTSSRRNSKGGGGGQIIILAISLILIILAPIFAQLLYFAISRKREYLADASGALYTRYPEGLASALEKIANSSSAIKSANQATAPMYISNPFRKSGMNVSELTSTHPPIADRIRILRAMAGASYADYEQAYKKAHSGQGVLPSSAMGLTGTVPVAAGHSTPEDLEPVERARETTDMLWNINKYKIINCECGTRLRVPPDYGSHAVRCPHCGRIHEI